MKAKGERGQKPTGRVRERGKEGLNKKSVRLQHDIEKIWARSVWSLQAKAAP